MYHHALDAGIKPAPLHSRNLTPLYPNRPDLGGGEAWANYVGGESVKPRKPKPGRDVT
jgi:hypothetical protein